jgi:membrane protein implicated in regulation of membrane protease activity
MMFGLSFSPALAWAAVGLLLLILELATQSFILCFIGLGALIVAATTWMGLTDSFGSQLIVFSISSLLLMFLLRKTAKKLFAGHDDAPPDYAGEKVSVVKIIPAGGEGIIQYRGSDWIAFSDESQEIPAGTVVRIAAIEGIRVKVKLIESS